jgi:hypothetical protein
MRQHAGGARELHCLDREGRVDAAWPEHIACLDHLGVERDNLRAVCEEIAAYEQANYASRASRRRPAS